MSSRKVLTEKELLEELEKGLSDIEGLDSDDSDYEEEVQVRQRVGQLIDDISEHINEEDNVEEIEDEENNVEEIENEEEEYNYEDFITLKKNVKWLQNVQYVTRHLPTKISRNSNENCSEEYPVTYFLRYFPESLFEDIVQYTNMYALQNGTEKFVPCNLQEIKAFFGLSILTGCLKFPRLRMYWDKSLKVDIFTDTMTINRMFKLRTHIHCVDNLAPRQSNDKLWKVRPIFESVLKRCRELQVETNVCIDEQIMPFKGRLFIKQYIKNKPHPWGVKLYLLGGESGLTYDFLIYQGSTTEIEPSFLKYGQGAGVILQLSKKLEPNKHILYCDNYFTSYHLLQILNQKSIFLAGTARLNRFSKPPLTDVKDFLKKKRGSTEQIISTDGIVVTRWLDNKPVIMVSNFVGVGKEDIVKRWDKTTKSFSDVNRPEVIQKYNSSMGGIDLADALIAFYRTKSRCKKWTIRLMFHAVDMALTNSWLEYKQNMHTLGIPKKDIMDLLHFRMQVGESLIKVNSCNNRKRGRPSSGTSSPVVPTKRRNVEVRPLTPVQYDNIGHFPEHPELPLPLRCKNPGCGGKSRWKCQKCNIHLCLQKERNCFLAFHQK